MQFRARRWSAVTGAIVSFLVLTSTQAFAVEVDLLNTFTSPMSNTAYSVDNLGFEPAQSIAVSFVVPTNASNDPWAITNINTSISAQFGPVTLNLGIMADNGGRPSGTFLSSVTLTAGPDPLSIAALNWSIGGGAKYWFAVIAHNDDAQWIGSQLQGTFGFSSGDTWMTESGPLPGAQITGFETPLPGAFVLFASGLGGIGMLGVRGRKKAAQPALMRSI